MKSEILLSGRQIALFLLPFMLCVAVPGLAQDSSDSDEGKEQSAKTPDRDLYDLHWVEGIHEILDKVIFTDERMPGNLPKSTRAAGIIMQDAQDWSLSPTIAEPLSRQAGVDFKRYSAADLVPVIRGLGDGNVAFYIDEFRLDSPALPSVLSNPLSAVDPFMTLRTEIIRGPSPIFHGGGAGGGVIQILSKRRLRFSNTSGVSTLAVGRVSTAEGEVSGHVEGEMNLRQNLGSFVGASARNLGVPASSEDEIYAADVHADNFSASADARLGGRIVISATHHHMRQSDISADPADPKSRDDYRRWDLSSMSLTINDMARALRYAKLTFGFTEMSHLSSRLMPGPQGEWACANAKVQGLFTNIVLDMPAGPYFSVIYGGEYRSDQVDSAVVNAERPRLADGAVYERPASYLAFRIQPTDHIKILPGIRVEGANVKADIADAALDDPELEYSKIALGYGLSGRLGITEYTSIFGGYRRGFNFPSLLDLAGSGKSNTIFHAPESDIDPEYIQSFELGYRMHYPFVKGQFVLYQNDLSNMIEQVPSEYDGLEKIDDAQVYQSQNLGEGRIRGFETGIETWLGINWNFGLNFSSQSGAYDDGQALISSPPYMGNVFLRWTNDMQIISFETATRFAGAQSDLAADDLETTGLDDESVPGYMTLDLRMGMAVGRYIDLKLGALNVTGSDVIHVGSRIPEPKQNFITQLRFNFY